MASFDLYPYYWYWTTTKLCQLSHWTVVSRKIEYFETQNAWFSEEYKSLHLTDDDGKASVANVNQETYFIYLLDNKAQ